MVPLSPIQPRFITGRGFFFCRIFGVLLKVCVYLTCQQTKTHTMTIQTNHRTFSKETRKQIKTMFPTAVTTHKVGAHRVIRDKEGNMLCTWSPGKRWTNGTLTFKA